MSFAAAGRQLDFLVGSESDVRHWGPLPPVPGNVTFRALQENLAVFGCAVGKGHKRAASRACFLKPFRNAASRKLPPATFGTSRPCCFAVSHAPGKGGSRPASRATFLRASESNGCAVCELRRLEDS